MSHRHALSRTVLVCAVLGACANTAAAEKDEAGKLDALTIIGDEKNARKMPGAAYVVDEDTLETYEYTDVERALREVPGVYTTTEDGYGLRPNIGMRGTGTERSSNITLMEDNVLIAPAPYAAPAAYYFPNVGRMEAVEVLKGPSSIRHGPRTLGGAVNLISRSIPNETSGAVDLAVGGDGFHKEHAWFGGGSDTASSVFEVFSYGADGFKDLDGGGDTGFERDDFVGKFRISTDPGAERYQSLEVKLQYAEETSDETYVGLTDADFADDPYRRYRGSALDEMNTDHQQIQATHFIELGHDLDLTTTAYYNQFARNWYKTDTVEGVGIGDILSDPSANANALSVLRGQSDGEIGIKANNREYYAKGVQSSLNWITEHDGFSHEVEAGVRIHRDEIDRFQWVDTYDLNNGNFDLDPANAGVPGTESNRVTQADAVALFAQDRLTHGAWTVVYGARYEDVTIERKDYGTSDPSRSGAPDKSEGDYAEFIPGAGLTYALTESLDVFGGVHRGFAPGGPDEEADAEISNNFELGLRYGDRALFGELIAFYNDYENLLGECTMSGGPGNCQIGDFGNLGEATIQGIEAQAGYTIFGEEWSWPFTAALTVTESEFDTDFDSSFFGEVEKGDEVPYLPATQFHASAGIEANRWRTNLSARFIDEVRTSPGNGSPADDEKTESAWVFDLAASYEFGRDRRVYATVDNLTDETYVTSRRPAGVRPNKPQTLNVGIEVDF